MKRCGILVMIGIVIFTFSGTALSEDIKVVGTGAGMSVLKAVADDFNQKFQGVKVIVPDSIGSSGGIKTVGNDEEKIGRVSRPLKETEAHYGLTYVPIVKLPIVFFVNKSVGIKDVTYEQICDIYSGRITNWKDIGGQDAHIRVIRREDGDSSLKVLLESFPGFADISITEKSKTTFSDQETLSLAEEKENTIAFGTYGNAREFKVNILTIQGKKASDADYPFNSVLALIFKENNNTGNIKKFVEFAISADAEPAIINAGGIPY